MSVYGGGGVGGGGGGCVLARAYVCVCGLNVDWC